MARKLGGVSFSRANQSYVLIQDSEELRISDKMCVATLVNLRRVPSAVEAFGLIFKSKEYLLRVHPDSYAFFVYDGADYEPRVKGGTPEVGLHLVVANMDFDGDYIKKYLYVDAEMVGEETTQTGNITGTANVVYVGGYSGYYSDVDLLAVYKWNRMLTDTEIQQLYQNPDNPPKDRLVLWLPFTEGMGVIAKDFSDNDNHGRLYRCKWVNQARRGMYFDNGGIRFDSGLNIDRNYCSVVAVFAIETLKKSGDALTGRNCIVRFDKDYLMLYNDRFTKGLRVTNYDGSWKSVESNIDLEAGQIYTGVGIMNGNEEHIYLASNGVIVDHNYRDDLGDCGEYTDTPVYIGSGPAYYFLHGEVLATMVYNRPITEDEIKQISEINGWWNPPRDRLISWILFDGLKEGDTVVDKITGAEGVQIGTPKFVIRKPVRVLSV